MQNIKKIRKQIEYQRAQKILEVAESYDTGDDIDTLQNITNRLVATVDKIDDKVVANDAAIIVNTKGISDNKIAIGANKTGSDLAVTLGSKSVSGGDLSSTAETIATEKFVTDGDNVIKAAYIAADTVLENGYKAADTAVKADAHTYTDNKFDTEMDVTFTDGTSAVYKIGS